MVCRDKAQMCTNKINWNVDIINVDFTDPNMSSKIWEFFLIFLHLFGNNISRIYILT